MLGVLTGVASVGRRRRAGRGVPVPGARTGVGALPPARAERALANGDRMAAPLRFVRADGHRRFASPTNTGDLLLFAGRTLNARGAGSCRHRETVKYVFLAWLTARYPARFIGYRRVLED